MEKINTYLNTTNDNFIKIINSNLPASIIRFGNTEAIVLSALLSNYKIDDNTKKWLEINAGVFPVEDSFLETSFKFGNIEAMLSSDCIGFVSDTSKIFFEKYFSLKAPTFSAKEICILNPICLASAYLNDSDFSPWTEHLIGKRILIVTPFINTFTIQLQKINKIWGKYSSQIFPFDIVGLIQSPFSPKVSNINYLDDKGTEIKNYIDHTINMMIQIRSFDFDILFVGAGAYAPLLANFAKSIGKIGITTCGDTQLFFGVLGERWSKNSNWWGDFSDFDKIVNDDWLLTPNLLDLPKNSNLINALEKSYW